MPGLEDLYREIILDHYRNPRNRGELPVPPATRVEGFNPLCGDEIVVYLIVSDGVVSDVRIGGQGCSISQASASMMTEAMTGKPVPDAEALAAEFRSMMEGGHEPDEDEFGDLVALKGVVKYPVRIKCAVLPWNSLLQGLTERGAATGPEAHTHTVGSQPGPGALS